MRYMVPSPPPKPTMKMTAAKAGEKRTCRSSAIGSITQRQPLRLPHRLQGLRELYARRRQQIRRDLQLRQSAHLGMEDAHRLQLCGALGATLDMSFQLVTRVIGQLVIKV